jgi:two-component system response regulator FlrC
MVVLIVERDAKESQMLARWVKEQGHFPVIADGVGDAFQSMEKILPDLILVNLTGSVPDGSRLFNAAPVRRQGVPVVAMAHKGKLEDAVRCMKEGAHDFWVKPISRERLTKTLEWFEAKRPSRESERPLRNTSLLTQSTTMVHLKAVAKRVALSKAAVFIQGESGTGKELFARYLHSKSDRSDKPFIAVNCAALPENLLESELFGYEKGAFTGAIKGKEGKFEMAHHGTLLLDEVTEMSVQVQAKLLRVLQENEVDRLGGKYPIPIDVRIIATSNAALEDAIAGGQFRRDLYYRLNVIPLKIPPLRSRKEDIELLGRHFVQKYRKLYKTCAEDLSTDALEKLKRHSWPGNVRELENVIQRGVLLAYGTIVTAENILFDKDHPCEAPAEMQLMTIGEMEKRLIHKALQAVHDNRTRAAEILGISVRTLRNKLHEYRQDQTAPVKVGSI